VLLFNTDQTLRRLNWSRCVTEQVRLDTTSKRGIATDTQLGKREARIVQTENWQANVSASTDHTLRRNAVGRPFGVAQNKCTLDTRSKREFIAVTQLGNGGADAFMHAIGRHA
jgi:hypothetical protein